MLASADPILAQVLKTRVASEEEFDELHAADLNLAIDDIARTHTTIGICIGKGVSYAPSRFDGLALLNGSLNTLLSSLFLTRQGAFVDAFALLRICVESACVAVHIVSDDKAYAQYKRFPTVYKSTTAISAVGHTIPGSKKFYGVLSKWAVHADGTTRGPRINADGSRVIKVGQDNSNPDQGRIALRAISLTGARVLGAAERTLFEEEAGQPNFIRLPRNELDCIETCGFPYKGPILSVNGGLSNRGETESFIITVLNVQI